MSHVYDTNFYDYIETGSRASALVVLDLLLAEMSISSVLDVGCGRGAWLDEWSKKGVRDIMGVDGDYVVQGDLKIPAGNFIPQNLAEPFDIGRQFDIVQSLEVAEHLPTERSAGFVESITNHGDIILFSAATPGQGGENHINEQPLSFWRRLFGQKGYQPFDFIRPLIYKHTNVMEWYRYNTLIYANDTGIHRLSANILATLIPPEDMLRPYGSIKWRMRAAVVGLLPRRVVNAIARTNARRFAPKR